MKVFNVLAGGKSASIVETTHAELVTLRDNAQLQPGQLYRITDYVATTTDPESRSANHPFDIIVIADDVDVLNENASAICHEGDTYFAKCHLETWKLKYSIDNDSTRFNWAQTDGKGVVYQMIDENNNEMQYDFKGIQFKRYKITASEKVPSFVGKWATKNNNSVTVDENDYRWCYLFNAMLDDDNYDASVYQYDASYESNIKNCLNKTKGLPNGICNIDTSDFFFEKYICHSWTCEDNCHSWTCDSGCHSWTCGSDCHSWICEDECHSWSCGSGCHSWTCGGVSHSWTCEDNCHSWTCDRACYSWSCGNNSYTWSCGNGCASWSCGNDCDSWTCGNNCDSWSCGSGCDSWTCGNDCSYWSCGNNSHTWSCGNGCASWSCGSSCSFWVCQDNYKLFNILNGVKGGFPNVLNLSFTPNVDYVQYAGYKTDGTLRVWNPADVE